MRSKTSFFNATIFKKNITRFWPICVIYSLFCIWVMPVYSYFGMREYRKTIGLNASQQTYLKLTRAMEGMNISLNPKLIFIFSIVSAVAVFCYLYNSRSVNMIHALPVCRQELFVTNYLSGFLFLLIPQVISFLLTVFVWFANGVTHLEYLLQWLGIVTTETFFAYSMGIFCVMLTGNMIAAPVYFIFLNYFYKGVCYISDMVQQSLIYGVTASKEIIYVAGLAPIDYFEKHVGVSVPQGLTLELPRMRGMDCLKWYALAALAFTALAWVIYKKRKLECAGDMIAVSRMKPVVRWTGAILCAGLFGQFIQTTFFQEKIISGEAFPILLVCWSAGGVLAFFGIEMLIQKRFLIFRKNILIQSGILLVLVFVFLSTLKADMFHLKQRMPEAEQVSELYVQGSYTRYINNPEKIQENIELQKKIIGCQKEYQQYFKKYYGKADCNFLTLTMKYVMKNGKKQSWSYALPLDEFYLKEKNSPVNCLLEQEESLEDYMAYYFTEQYSNMKIQSGNSIDWVDERGNFQNIDISTENAEEIVKAFKKDVTSGKYRIYPYGMKNREKHTYVNTLSISYMPPKGAHLLQYGELDNISDGEYLEYSGIVLTTECENTIALLEKMGYVDEKHKLITEEEYQIFIDAAGNY